MGILSFKLISHDFSRFKRVAVISMMGVLMDKLVTDWVISTAPQDFFEANPIYHPEIGLPLMILNYVICDQLLPHNHFYDKLFYGLALIAWAAPIHNLLVYLRLLDGLNMNQALPVLFLGNICLLTLRDRLRSYITGAQKNHYDFARQDTETDAHC